MEQSENGKLNNNRIETIYYTAHITTTGYSCCRRRTAIAAAHDWHNPPNENTSSTPDGRTVTTVKQNAKSWKHTENAEIKRNNDEMKLNN